MFLIFAQATVYLCGPIASVWNLRAQAVPGHVQRRRFAERRLRAQRRRRAAWAPFTRRAAAGLTALCVGGVTSAFVFPIPLLHANRVARTDLSPWSLLASAGTEVYLKLGSSTTGAGRVFYPIIPTNLSDLAASSPGGSASVGLTFDTSSVLLLGEILRAAADGGQFSHVSLAFVASGRGGRLATERVDTFAKVAVTSIAEQLSRPPGTPAGQLLAPAPRSQRRDEHPGHLGARRRVRAAPRRADKGVRDARPGSALVCRDGLQLLSGGGAGCRPQPGHNHVGAAAARQDRTSRRRRRGDPGAHALRR